MNITPIKSLPSLTVCTPIGTKDVHLVGDEVVGLWSEELTDYYGPKGRLLVEDFVNWSHESKEIVRFTALYAPLSWTVVIPGQQAAPGQEFRFYLENWRNRQNAFRRVWGEIVRKIPPVTEMRVFTSNDVITLREGELVYRAGMLGTFLPMELFKVPVERLRKCQRPECSTPYFVARHMRQRYCSPFCAEWAQSQSKKQWWKTEGPDWLKTRKHSRKPRRR